MSATENNKVIPCIFYSESEDFSYLWMLNREKKMPTVGSMSYMLPVKYSNNLFRGNLKKKVLGVCIHRGSIFPRIWKS